MSRDCCERKKIDSLVTLENAVGNQADCQDVQGSLYEKDQKVSPHDDFCASAGFLDGEENRIYELKDYAHDHEAGINRSLKKKGLGHFHEGKKGVHEGDDYSQNSRTDEKGEEEKCADLAADCLHVT